jgi:hypothetical protein
MSERRRKITESEWCAALTRARGKSLQKRRAIAHEFGISFVTFEYNRRGVEKEGWSYLRRQSRSDRGQPRSLPSAWARASLIEMIRGPAEYSRVYRRLLVQYDRLGVKPPSYSALRRAISERFKQLMAHSQIRKIGNFKRVEKED